MARFFAALVILLTLLSLLALFNVQWRPVVQEVLLPAGMVMNPLVALGLLVLGLALLQHTLQRERLGFWLTTLVAGMSGLCLLFLQVPVLYAINRWVFSRYIQGMAPHFPVQIAPTAVLELLLLSLALLALNLRHRRTSQLLVVVAFLGAAWTLQGYLYGTLQRDPGSFLYPMALNVAVGLLFLGAGITYLQHSKGMGNIQFESHAGGLLTRWLFPVALLLPPLLTLLVMHLVRADGMAWEHGMGWLAFSTTLVLLPLAYALALALKKADLEHQLHVQNLQSSEARYRAVTEKAADAIITTNATGRILTCNQSAQELFGYREHELQGRDFTVLLPEPTRSHYQQNLLEYMQGEIMNLLDRRVEIQGQTREGHIFPLELSVSIWELEGERFFTGTVRDLSRRDQLADQQARLASLLAHSRDSIVSSDTFGKVLFWNPAAEQLLGYSAEEMVGASIHQIFPGHLQHESQRIRQVMEQGGSIVNLETERVHKDGHLVFVSVSFSPVRNAAGEVVGATSIARDISETRNAREQLANALAYSQTQAEVSRILDQDLSPADSAREVTLLVSEVMDLDFACLVTLQELDTEVQPVWEKASGAVHEVVQKMLAHDLSGWLERSSRQRHPLYINDVKAALPTALLDDLKGVPEGVIAAFVPLIPLGSSQEKPLVFVACSLQGRKAWSREDRNLFEAAGRSVRVTVERQERLRRMEAAALTDPLTQLGNRRAFQEDLQSRLSAARRHRHPLCLVQLDLDGLKKVNDFSGHDAGDRLLQVFAHHLREHMRIEDRCYRLGGDEFAVLLSHSPLGSQEVIFERVREVIQQVQQAGFPHSDVSVGMAYFPEEASTIHDLLRLSDERMYQMKDQHHQMHAPEPGD
ncbi:sensor domain-containing diguanylate cyclase [Deinococcus roseus]|uniref:PAS domain S-box protein n=1 Tax=Deinococcus roseus TaxID=392414 RepID=A0ABQ2DBS8_9DEIO|nr:PAS domain S-box protein [Deinococcus roseus]GGJ52328.1 hypothetical protein GCM10008938_42910 [Deinococcus roseus]